MTPSTRDKVSGFSNSDEELIMLNGSRRIHGKWRTNVGGVYQEVSTWTAYPTNLRSVDPLRNSATGELSHSGP